MRATTFSIRPLQKKINNEWQLANMQPIKNELIGGESFRQITTWHSTIDRQGIDNLRKMLANNPIVNVLHKESHTAEGDTLELTAELFQRHIKGLPPYDGRMDNATTQRILNKFYGKGEQQTAHIQLINETANPSPFAVPFSTMWVDEYIAQMKRDACMEEHAVHYEYGKKSDPASMGKVEGRLYVLTAPDNQQRWVQFCNSAVEHALTNKNQEFHLVFEPNRMRVTDRILFHCDVEKDQYRLLYIAAWRASTSSQKSGTASQATAMGRRPIWASEG